MRWVRLLAALVVVTGTAMAAPPQQLQILADGHVRLNGGAELDMPHFRVELKRLSAHHAPHELELHVGKQAKYAAVAAVLAEMQKAGFRIAGAIGFSN